MATVIAVPANLSSPRARRLIGTLGSADWVYFGKETEHIVRWRRLAGGERQIPLARDTIEVARRILPSYLAWVDSLAAKHGRDEFRWLSEIFERNVFVSNIFLHLTYLVLWKQIAAKLGAQKLLVVVQSPALAETLKINTSDHQLSLVGFRGRRWIRFATRLGKMFLHKLAFLARESIYLWLARRGDMAAARRLGPGEKVLIHSWAEADAASDRTAIETYFGRLPDWLREQGYEVVCLPWFFHQTSFAEYVRRVRRSGVPSIIPEELLTPVDVLRATFTVLFRRAPPRGRAFIWDGFDVSRLVEEDRWRQLASNRPPLALLHYLLISRIAERGLRVRTLFHIYEGQIWERALALSIRRFLPDAEVVGFQHASVGEFEASVRMSRNFINEAEIPDRIVCQGPLWRDVLAENGIPPGRLRVGCSLRYEHLFHTVSHAGQGSPCSLSEAHKVVVALGLELAESVDVFLKVLEAFRSQSDLRIYIKPHPKASIAAIIKRAFGRVSPPNSLPQHFSVVAGTISEWLAQAQLLVHSGSTASYEALAMGIPAIFVARECGLPFAQVPNKSGFAPVVFSARELTMVARKALALSREEREELRREGQALLRSCFRPVSDDALKVFRPRPGGFDAANVKGAAAQAFDEAPR